jgi:hypothetical protein
MKLWLTALIALLLLSGCSNMINSASRGMADNLNQAILNQNDPETVRQGVPAYLIMIDSFIQGSPDDADLLSAGSNLYGAYAGSFVNAPERAQRLSDRSLDYAGRAFCITLPDHCGIRTERAEAFKLRLQTIPADEVDALYTLGTAWAGWVQTRTDDWDAIAELPKIRAIMEYVLILDETHDQGGPHLYLGVLNSLLPPAMGGKPEVARQHFERAIELSEGQNLMAKTLYAQYYARLLFDQELHDRQLNEVISADPESPGKTLANVLAQQKARELLAESSEFF